MLQKSLTKKDICERIEKLIGLKVSNLYESGGGWYTVAKTHSPSSTRHVVTFKADASGFKALVYDHKTQTTQQISLAGIAGFQENKQSSKPKLTHFYNEKWATLKDYKDNGYLKAHKLKGRYTHLKSDNNRIAVAYSPVDISSHICGIKYYSLDGKICEKGSVMKGSVAYHHKGLNNDTVYVGEGLSDCLTILHCFDKIDLANTTVVESGSLGNTKNIIHHLKQEYKTVVLVGENDSVSEYIGYKQKNVQVIFPPTGKDISDYFQENGYDATRTVLFDTDSVPSSYRPLGFLGKNVVLYSKKIRAVADYPISSQNELISLGMGFSGFSEIPKETKSSLVDKVINECSTIGQYSTKHERGVGLFKYKDNHYYNTGRQIYDVTNKKFKSYGSVVRDDFLLSSNHTVLKLKGGEKFDMLGFLGLLRNFDWVEPWYGDVVLGFLVQSVFAGASEFSPHLWIKSNLPKAGKSWISDFIRENLFPDCPASDGAGTSHKGFRQDARFYSGLTFVDEFAEEGTVNRENAKGIFQTLRSACTGKTPVTLGQPNQVPIKLFLKFSSLLTCLTGIKDLKPQDYERIIFLNLERKDPLNFLQNVLPKVNQFMKENKAEGFLMTCLNNFKDFHSFVNKWEILVNSETKKSLGHKSRGFASVLGGYECVVRDEKETLNLMRKILDSPLSEPLHDKDYQSDMFESLLEEFVPKDISGGVTAPLYAQLCTGRLKSYGIYIDFDQGKKYILINVAKFKPLLDKLFKGANVGIITKELISSPHYVTIIRKRVNDSRLSFMQFNWLSKWDEEE